MMETPERGRYWERIELPALSDEQRDLLADMRHELLMRLRPGRDEEIVAPLARMANHHSKERTPAEWKMLFEDFCFDLREFSGALVQQACLDHRRASNWFPKIAELRQRCIELRELDKSRLERCERNLAQNASA